MKRVIFLVALLAAGCQGINLSEEGEAFLTLSISKEDVSTKAFVHQIPDTNLLTLVISKGSDTLYKGLYGLKPSKLTIPAGQYNVDLYSYKLREPVLGNPCWGDSRQIILEKNKTTALSLDCRQLTGGVKLIFTKAFKDKYDWYTPAVYNEFGTVNYLYSENRFVYLRPGKFFVKIMWATDFNDHLPIFTHTIQPNDMITYSVDLGPVDSATVGGGIIVDTVSNWKTDSVYLDRVDGRTAGNAIEFSRWEEFINIKTWYNAYIVGTDVTSDSVKFVPPFDKNSHIALASDPAERRRDKIYGANLASTMQTLYGLASNPGMLGRKIKIRGTFSRSYLGGAGMTTTYEIIPQ
jgi:hypothetical protein